MYLACTLYSTALVEMALINLPNSFLEEPRQASRNRLDKPIIETRNSFEIRAS